MADRYPYTSGVGALTQAVSQFRNAFPAQVGSDTLKKLSIAPNNESYLINIFRFIGLLDKEGKKTPEASAAFTKHGDEEFQSEFSNLVKKAYLGLFELHGDAAWTLPMDKLIGFFRNTDQTSSIVGQRQAVTFQALAAIAGHTSQAPVKQQVPRAKVQPTKTVPSKKERQVTPVQGSSEVQHPGQPLTLSMRVEINLPIAPDQETYDRIFKSIRENLLNA